MVDQKQFLAKYGIDVVEKISIERIPDEQIEHALDNFALIIRELDQFQWDYDKALNYGRKVFRGIESVYVIDTDRESVDHLSMTNPWVAAMIDYDVHNRRWLYFSADHIESNPNGH